MVDGVDGVHDMGGMHGFGSVVTDDGDLTSHEPWETRAQIVALISGLGTRAAIERIEPDSYLASGYYERWLRAAENTAIHRGLLTAAELDSWRDRLADPDTVMPTRSDPGVAYIIRTLGPHHHGDAEDPSFAVGDRVQVRRMRPEAHHRCPRYLRGAIGQVEKVLGDDPVPGLPPEEAVSETCYTVRFESSDLFGADAAEGPTPHVVLIDLWERYLEGPP